MPIQSNGLPLISLFFLFSLSYTFISFVWFALVNEMKTRKYLPKIFNIYMSKLKRTNKIETNSNNSDNLTEFNINILNKIAFSLITIAMTFSYLAIWISISSSS
jgi:hypothetical protein